MNLLFRIITAAHARGTHHRLALDGIARLSGPHAERWQRLFLKHAAELVEGSKAPDDEFKDFKNHVLHPRDGFWGGAPVEARNWYGQLVEALGRGDWPEAARCAGILSHYVTDPINPLHTAQSEAENNIHRAVEWSISRSYDALKAIAGADAPRTIEIVDAPNWLEQLLCASATRANVHYEKLIAHYDFHRGVVDPPSGLDVVAQRLVGDLIGEASAVFATVLGHAIEEAQATPPEVSLTIDAVLATLRIPLKKLLSRLVDAKERKLVEAMYDELKATGTVEVNLPADDRVVRDLHAAEVIARRDQPDPATLFPVAPREAIERRPRQPAMAARAIPQPASSQSSMGSRGSVPSIDPRARELPVDEPPRPAPRAADLAVPVVPVSRFRGEPVAPLAAAVEAPVAVATAVPVEAAPRPIPADRAAASMAAALAQVAPFASRPAAAAGAPRIYLTATQDIVDAPSIGPKMAERLIPIGLKTVGDLFKAAPDRLAERLDVRGVDAETVRDWQDQARLVCTVPGLRGTHAQLLVGAGFRSAAAIAEADAGELCVRVLGFAASSDGQRVLRNGDAPDIERIKTWVDNARSVRAA